MHVNESGSLSCHFCGGKLTPHMGRGRPKLFCNRAHRDRWYRRNRNAANRQIDDVMEAMERSLHRTYGGHLERDGSSTIDGVKRGEMALAINRRLAEILGGVPTGRRRALVLELPGPSGITPEMRKVAA